MFKVIFIVGVIGVALALSQPLDDGSSDDERPKRSLYTEGTFDLTGMEKISRRRRNLYTEDAIELPGGERLYKRSADRAKRSLFTENTNDLIGAERIVRSVEDDEHYENDDHGTTSTTTEGQLKRNRRMTAFRPNFARKGVRSRRDTQAAEDDEELPLQSELTRERRMTAFLPNFARRSYRSRRDTQAAGADDSSELRRNKRMTWLPSFGRKSSRYA